MRLAELEGSLAEGSTPLLSAYLEATPAGSGRRSITSSPPWIRKVAKGLENGMAVSEREAFRAQVNRVEAFLRSSAPAKGALAIFASPDKWICLHLPSPVSNELHWGPPSLSQLRRIAEEQPGICVVAVDRAVARFFRYELGEISELPAMKFEIDASQWKRKEHGHMARRNTKMPHGPLRDAFKQRMDQQYQHFFRHISERIKFVLSRENLRAVMLVGSARLTKPIEAILLEEIRERAVLIPEDLARVSPTQLEAKILPNIAEWMRRFSEARAARLMESDRGAVVGFDETLAELQNGRIGTLLIVRDLDAGLRQCTKCGDVNRSADPVCVKCGGARRQVTLTQVLDGIAEEHHTRIEILDPDAAKGLAKAGGMGGWLRQPTLVAAR
jgi:Bacterial archaeo-eukaryotic release factor family 5